MATKTLPAERPTINRNYVESYVRLRERKRQLETMARNLGKLMSVMEAEFDALVEEKTKPKDPRRVVNVGGWEIAREEKPGRVSWAEEFVRHVGATIAQQVKDAVKKVTRIAVRPATTTTIKAERDIQEDARGLTEHFKAAA